MRHRFPIAVALAWLAFFLLTSERAAPGTGFLGVAGEAWSEVAPYLVAAGCGLALYAMYVVLFRWSDDAFGKGIDVWSWTDGGGGD